MCGGRCRSGHLGQRRGQLLQVVHAGDEVGAGRLAEQYVVRPGGEVLAHRGRDRRCATLPDGRVREDDQELVLAEHEPARIGLSQQGRRAVRGLR